MPRVTEQLLRKRSEHNDGLLSTLEEVDLHQEGLTRLGPRLRRACPRLQHLSLSGNAIGRLAACEARGLRSLRTLNLALNCLRRLPSAAVMRGLEALERLDLIANFLDASALFALGERVGFGGGGGGGGGSGGGDQGALAQLPRLRELWLMGNPCVDALRKAAAVVVAGPEEQQEEQPPPQGASPAPATTTTPTSLNAYRSYVLLALPQLERLDGEPATASARLAARRAEGQVARALRRAAAAELGFEEEEDGEAAATAVSALELSVLAGEEHPETLALYGPPGALDDETSESEDDEDEDEDDANARPRCRRRPRVQETGTLDRDTGEVRRPWCPATRLLDLRDQRRAKAGDAGGGGGAGKAPPPPAAATDNDLLLSGPAVERRQPRRQALPPLPEQDPGTGETLPLRNEGKWRFSLDVVPSGGGGGGRAGGIGGPSSLPPPCDEELELDVDVGKYLDTSHMQLEVLPRAVRLLVLGRLLQLRLPAEVRADACAARRSRATGRLSVRMPLLSSSGAVNELIDPTLVHPRSVWGDGEEGGEKGWGGRKEEERGVGKAAVVVAVATGRSGEEEDDDGESPPPL